MTDKESLHTALVTFTAAVAEKLRRQRSCAMILQVFIDVNHHKTDIQYGGAHSIHFGVATDSTLEMTKAIPMALNAIFKKGYAYKRAGVTAMGIIPRESVQTNIFDSIDRGKHHRLMKAIDSINVKEGQNTIKLASQNEVPDFSNRKNVSPLYTTSLNDVIEVII